MGFRGVRFGPARGPGREQLLDGQRPALSEGNEETRPGRTPNRTWIPWTRAGELGLHSPRGTVTGLPLRKRKEMPFPSNHDAACLRH